MGKQHRYRQHRYALATDAEVVRPVILSTAKEEAHLILRALLQIEKNLEDKSMKEAELESSLAKAIQIYEEKRRILDLVSQFTSEELIEILESKKKSNFSESHNR